MNDKENDPFVLGLVNYASSSDESEREMNDKVKVGVTACRPEVCLSGFNALLLGNIEQEPLNFIANSILAMTSKVLCPQEKPKKAYQIIINNECRFNHKGRRNGGLQGPYHDDNCMKNRGGDILFVQKNSTFFKMVNK